MIYRRLRLVLLAVGGALLLLWAWRAAVACEGLPPNTSVSARTAQRGEALPSGNAALAELDLGLGAQTLKAWYEEKSGKTGDDRYFGAYVTLPVTAGGSSRLYIGLGSARPAEDSGAYLATFDGITLTGIARLHEEGLHEMLYDGTALHIAGTDPDHRDGDDHSAGNHYVYTPTTGTLAKYRDGQAGLVNVFHTWGLWLSDTVLYAAVSAHTGDYTDTCASNYGAICMGQIFTSTDRGATWTKASDLGDYRAYDVTGYNGDLYAIHNDELGGALSMSRSTDGGQTWTGLPALREKLRRVHLVEFGGRLIAAGFDRATLYALSAAGTVTTHTLPAGYRVGTAYTETFASAYTDYNVLAVAGDSLYLIAQQPEETGCAILRTADLQQWERMAQTPERLISLSQWADGERNGLVAASAGTAATLWYLDLRDAPAALTLRAFHAVRARAWRLAALLAGMASGLGLLRRRGMRFNSGAKAR